MSIDLSAIFWSQYFYVANRQLTSVPSIIPEIPSTVTDPIFLRYWEKVKNKTLLDIFRAKKIWDLALEAKDLEGDFIECGSYQGGIACLLGFLIKEFQLTRRVFLCDSFQGLPPPSLHDQLFQAGTLRADLDACSQFIRDHHLQDIVIIKAGWFEETLPQFPATQRYALMHIDCDLYQSAITCFFNLCPAASHFAPVIIDDYNIFSPGVRLAAREYLAIEGETLELGPVSQVYFRKGESRAEMDYSLSDPENFPLSYRDLLSNHPYLVFLTAVRNHHLTQNTMLAEFLDRLGQSSNPSVR